MTAGIEIYADDLYFEEGRIRQDCERAAENERMRWETYLIRRREGLFRQAALIKARIDELNLIVKNR